MKRIFVLNKNWFDAHRDTIEALESDLLSLRLTDAQQKADDLMAAALQQAEGVQLADDELEWLTDRALEQAPRLVALLARCHVGADDVAPFREALNRLTGADATHSIRELTSALATDDDVEILILEDDPELEIQIEVGRRSR